MDSDYDDYDDRRPADGQLPAHVQARVHALANGFETLVTLNGAVPTPLPYNANYLKAVHRECVRELHGILGNCHVPRGDQWLSCTSTEEAGICLNCDSDEKRREYDNNLVLLIDDHGDGEPRVALVRHQRDSKRLLVKPYCRLENVLGYSHCVVDRIRHIVSRGYAPAKPCAVLVSYVGDLVAPMAACYMNEFRARIVQPDVGNGDEDDDLDGFEVSMMTTLSTGQRTPVQWPVVDRARVPHLNDSQYGTLDSLSRNVELIKGPPGTGKSTLIDALVRECVVDDDAVCVTAVQNRAALAIKFAAAKTPFIACGTRACDETLRWTLKAQVERNAGVVQQEARLRACERLRATVRARVARAMSKIYRPLVDTEDSDRQRIRERRERQLVANPSAALRESLAYRAWEEAHHRDPHTKTAKRELAELVETHMKHLDPWRRAATALVRARMPLAYEFLDTLAYEVERAQYALDQAREAATEATARGAKALLCTTATVAVAMRAQAKELGPLLQRLRVLVCDEAGTLADRHIVPVLAAAPVSRLVLVGDPAQLPCFTHVRNEEPTSAMQRLLNLGMPSSMLTHQYRMPPALCSVVSAAFYDDQLVTAEGRNAVGVAAPIRFLAVPKGRAEMPNATGKGGSSVVNREEVRVVVREAERLRGRYPTDLDLAILTTYAAQRAAIAEALGDGVAKVLTVDSAQGQEFDHVIYSHVASDPQRLGFTKKANRLCVALSRAKRALVVVAHPSVVSAIPALNAVRAASFEDGDAVRRMLIAAQRDAIVRGVDHGGSTMRVCAVCQDPISNAVGYLECDPPVARAVVHALCPECAEGHVQARLEADDFDGRLCCPCAPDAAGGCLAPPYEVASVARVVSAATFTRFNRAVVARHEMAVARQLEADFEDRVAARVAAVTLQDDADRAIADDVAHIVDTILTLRCPACQLAFVDFDACALLQCRCGVQFCGFCLHPNATHEHVAECHENPLHERGERGVFVTRMQWELAQHARKQHLVRAHLANAAQEHRAAVLERLRPHGIDIW